jgi:hypothetical protein
MYLALFLSPWLIMYAASTMAMNHRAWFRTASAGPPVLEKEREAVFRGQLPAGADPKDTAIAVLRELGMEGAHNVNASADQQRITIVRQDAIAPRRVVFTPADNKVVIEKQKFEMPAFLERMHRRRGFQHTYALDDVWAFSVDLVIAAIVFWALSGLWLWWEMKKTRTLGFAAGAAGFLLFAIFLFRI